MNAQRARLVRRSLRLLAVVVLLVVTGCADRMPAAAPDSASSGPANVSTDAVACYPRAAWARWRPSDLIGQPLEHERLRQPPADVDSLAGKPYGEALATSDELAGRVDIDGFVALRESERRALVGQVADDRLVGLVALEQADGSWRIPEQGLCEPRSVADQRRTIAWTVADVSDDGHRLVLSVHGSVCTDFDLAREPEGGSPRPVTAHEETSTRVVETIVDESDDEVQVKIWVRERPPASGSCTGGEAMDLEVEVELDEPLGSRQVVDGGVVPPTPVDTLLDAAEAR